MNSITGKIEKFPKTHNLLVKSKLNLIPGNSEHKNQKQQNWNFMKFHEILVGTQIQKYPTLAKNCHEYLSLALSIYGMTLSARYGKNPE